VAHFSVQVVSVSDERLVDLIAFRDDPEDENAYATFSAPELLPFLKYYDPAAQQYGPTSSQSC
jgi:hypothetical protein